MKNLNEICFWGSELTLEEHFAIDLCSAQLPFSKMPERIPMSIVGVCTNGSAQIQVDGVKYTIEKGMGLSIFPQQVVEQIQKENDFKLMYFSSSTEILIRVFFRFPPEFGFFLKEYPVYSLPANAYKHFKKVIKDIQVKYSDKKNIVRNEIILGLIRLFYLEIYNKIHHKLKVSPGQKVRQHEIFRDFIKLLIRDCKQSREVKFYAEKLNITPKYLSAITNGINGYGAKKIIDSFIITEIKMVLKSTNSSIQEIVDTFNFPDQAFFSKFFKSQTGYTPMQYRNS